MFQKLSTFNTPFRYLLFVGCGFVIDFLVYSALVSVGFSVYFANAVAFSIGTVINVILIRMYVFPESKFSFGTDLPLTFAVNGSMLCVSMVFLWMLVDLASINPYWAKIATNGATFMINYTIRSVFFTK